MTRRSAILGYIVLIVLLSAGTAQSLSGSNTVDTGDIIDGQVYSTDIKNGTITGADVAETTLHPHSGFALVKANGELVGGNASSATYNSTTKNYTVVFPFTVAGCAATAQPGQFPGADSEQSGVQPFNFQLGRLEPHTISMTFTNGSSAFPTAFTVALVCP